MSGFMEKVKSGVAGIGKKTSQTYEIGKLKLEISKHNNAINKETEYLGELTLEHFEQGREHLELKNSLFQKPLENIRFHKEKIEALKEKIELVREQN